MLFDDFAADCFAVSDRAVVRALRSGEAFCGESEGTVGFRVPQGVFLFETEPEILVVVVDGRTPVGSVRGSIGVQDFTHDEEASAHAARIGNDFDGL